MLEFGKYAEFIPGSEITSWIQEAAIVLMMSFELSTVKISTW